MDLPVVKIIVQRFDMDCSVAGLAMLLGVSYENALVAIAQDHPDVCVVGAWTKHLKAAARRLGYTLHERKRYDVETDTGLLNVTCPQWKHDHLVVLKEGLIIDTDGTVFDSDVYFQSQQATPGTLLVAEKRG